MKQPDNTGTVKDLVLHRIETAKSDIKSAQILLDAGEYRSSNNRSYYGIYHAYLRFMPWMEMYIKSTRMLWQILTKNMSRQRFFREI